MVRDAAQEQTKDAAVAKLRRKPAKVDEKLGNNMNFNNVKFNIFPCQRTFAQIFLMYNNTQTLTNTRQEKRYYIDNATKGLLCPPHAIFKMNYFTRILAKKGCLAW